MSSLLTVWREAPLITVRHATSGTSHIPNPQPCVTSLIRNPDGSTWLFKMQACRCKQVWESVCGCKRTSVRDGCACVVGVWPRHLSLWVNPAALMRSSLNNEYQPVVLKATIYHKKDFYCTGPDIWQPNQRNVFISQLLISFHRSQKPKPGEGSHARFTVYSRVFYIYIFPAGPSDLYCVAHLANLKHHWSLFQKFTQIHFFRSR